MTTARFTAPVSFWRTPDELVSYEEGQEVTGDDAVFVLSIPTLPVVEVDAAGAVIRSTPFAEQLASTDVALVDGDTATSTDALEG